MLTLPVTAPFRVSVRAMPHFEVVMLSVPSNAVPLMERAVCSLVALPALPVTAMPHVPDAPLPVLVTV